MKGVSRYFIALSIALAGSSCLMKAGNARLALIPDELAISSGAGSLEGFRTSVYPHTRANCASCHASFQVPFFANSELNVAHMAAVPLANFVELSASRIYTKSKDGHCGGPCINDGSVMLGLLQQWKAALSQGEGGGGEVPIGNVFTGALPVPNTSPFPGQPACNLPADLAISADNPGNRCWTKLKFPVSQFLPESARIPLISRAWLEVDFAYGNYESAAGPAAYVIRNPRVVSPDSPVYIFDVKFFQNGIYRPNHFEAYRQVDKVVPSTQFPSPCPTVPAFPNPYGPNLPNNCVHTSPPLFSTSPSSSGIVQERNHSHPSGPDTISFSFEYFQPGILRNCIDLAVFRTHVFNPIKIGALACLNCHRQGGGIGEAGRRFNMDPEDPINWNNSFDVRYPSGHPQAGQLVVVRPLPLSNPPTRTPQELQIMDMNVCNKFLQRVNFTLPNSSPIIIQPRQGLNGMPPQENFEQVAPDWLYWIERERI